MSGSPACVRWDLRNTTNHLLSSLSCQISGNASNRQQSEAERLTRSLGLPSRSAISNHSVSTNSPSSGRAAHSASPAARNTWQTLSVLRLSDFSDVTVEHGGLNDTLKKPTPRPAAADFLSVRFIGLFAAVKANERFPRTGFVALTALISLLKYGNNCDAVLCRIGRMSAITGHKFGISTALSKVKTSVFSYDCHILLDSFRFSLTLSSWRFCFRRPFSPSSMEFSSCSNSILITLGSKALTALLHCRPTIRHRPSSRCFCKANALAPVPPAPPPTSAFPKPAIISCARS